MVSENGTETIEKGIIKKMELDYSDNKHQWSKARIILLKDKLLIRNIRKIFTHNISDLVLNNLETDTDQKISTITCNSKFTPPYHLRGEKERVTSLFLSITNIKWRDKIIKG